jgi:hypothetical protein
MDGYSTVLEDQIVRFYRSLNERDRRRYAAVEAAKLGHGGIEYVSRLLGCDPKAIGRGMTELEAEEELSTDRQRKKGADKNR